jgi:integrase
MRSPKHLPLVQWPRADHAAFLQAYAAGDVFDDTAGPGAHLAEGTRQAITTSWRRWLGFLARYQPNDLELPPADRITPLRVRQYVEHLRTDVRPTSVAMAIDGLYYGARLIAPALDWAWLKALRARLQTMARPIDRFERLVPPHDTLDYGIELMDQAIAEPDGNGRDSEVQYRDGLLLALLSLWTIRRRSIGALTVSRHVERDEEGVTILLHSEDTKSGRSERFGVPDQLVPYVVFYLDVIRPGLIGNLNHDGFWASRKSGPLTGQSLYANARNRVLDRFGKAMGLHDFRRAAASFLAMDAPDKIGLIPGMLQHTSPDVGDQHYNLAESISAGHRHAAHVARLRSNLRAADKRPRN